MQALPIASYRRSGCTLSRGWQMMDHCARESIAHHLQCTSTADDPSTTSRGGEPSSIVRPGVAIFGEQYGEANRLGAMSPLQPLDLRLKWVQVRSIET